MLGAPVLMVTGGGVGNVIDQCPYEPGAVPSRKGLDVRAVLANKLIPEKRVDIVLDYLQPCLRRTNPLR